MTLFLFRRLCAILRQHRRRSFYLLATVLSAFHLATSIPGKAEPRQAPNSRISLDLGKTFEPSDRFSGFVDKSAGVSFVIVELAGPRPFEELKTLPQRKEALAQQGLKEAVVSELPGRRGEYVYFTAKQTVGGQDVAKFILIFREAGLTAMISTNVPQAALDAGLYTKSRIEAILTTAVVEDQPATPAELFRFSYLGPFQEAFDLAGAAKAYGISRGLPAPGENRLIKEPMLIVAPSLGTRKIDPKNAATLSFQNLAGLKNNAVESEKVVEIGGLKGYQIIGETADKDADAKITINFVLLAGAEGGYYSLVGTVPYSDKDKFMPELEKVIASFEVVEP